MNFFVDLQARMLHALVRGGLRSGPVPAWTAAPSPLPGAQVLAPPAGSDALQALVHLDDTTVWPTHRIRCCLHAQTSPTAYTAQRARDVPRGQSARVAHRWH